MDKAPDFGSGDCRFESCHVRNFFFLIFILRNHTDKLIPPHFGGIVSYTTKSFRGFLCRI